jgi:hypothetical protein
MAVREIPEQTAREAHEEKRQQKSEATLGPNLTCNTPL